MRWSIVASAALVTALARDAGATTKRTVIDRIVAVVDDACITKSQLERYAAPYEKSASVNATSTELAVISLRVQREALTALVDRLLVEREAARVGLTVSDEDVERAVDSVASANGMTREALFDAVATQGMDAAGYRGELRSQILEGKLLQIEAPKRNSDWGVLSTEAKTARLAETRVSLVADLRSKAFVEVRL